MKISIITINYNNANGLDKTLESVASQTYANIEHIIIDGNSSDGSKDILEAYELPNAIKISEPDSGIYNAMNKGVKKASGDYLLFINSGDSLRSNDSIETIVPLLSGGKDFYYGDLMMQFTEGDRIRKYPDTLSFYYFFHKGSLPHPSLFFKKTLFTQLGLYNEKFKIVADWDYYVKAICKHDASYEHIPIVVSNFDAYGISSDPKYRALLLKEKEESITDHFSSFKSDYEVLQMLQQDKNASLVRSVHKISHNRYAMKFFTIFIKILSKVFKK
ncbi:glycosyltransferase family 2 protein [uncultured Dokdonia sp.]|uniref:glycosyltransferase family 2 protein n=1 Tax=uncultured Dokdonia sp. TaxID=575653 RepID=UPI002634A617|nr:glycosyltransferase family 2 protein [uncultured Dokdonia sp.]